MKEEKIEKEFEEWFRQQDPEPQSSSSVQYEYTLKEEREKEEWNIRFFSTKLGYLRGRRDEAKESKLGGCYNLLCHAEKVQSEKKVVELEEKIKGLKVKINHLAEDLKQVIETVKETSGYPK